jgi:hypothetical protein
MKIKRIMLLLAMVICLGITSSLSIGSADKTSPMVEGEYHRVSQKLFENHLWVESTGLTIQGMHTYGPITKTDLLVVGGKQDADVSLQGYYPNMTNHIPVDYHNDAEYSEVIRDSVKVNNGGEMMMIYSSGYIDQNTYEPKGKIVCQDFVDPYKIDNALQPQWSTTALSDEVYALTLGNFDTDADPEVAGVTFDGKVYMIGNTLSSSISKSWDFSDAYWSRSDMPVINTQINTPIAAIDDLDELDSIPQDIIVGHYENVTALSTHSSNSEIWIAEIGYFISDLVVVEDINGDSEQDIVVASSGGLFLLSGEDGTILSTKTDLGTYYCDVEVFNSTAVISGDRDGDVIIWDVDSLGSTYNTTQENNIFSGYDVYDLLVVEDLNGDGTNEVAVGGEKSICVIYGNNLTKIWSGRTYGSSWDGNSINIYDMVIVEDFNGDGFGDLAVTGWTSDAGMADAEGAVFLFSVYGQLQFVPDLTAGGYIVGGGSCFEASDTIEFTATAYQTKGVPITTAKLIIDSTETLLTTDETDWASGVTYTYSASFNDGEHTFYFYFEDDHGNTYETSHHTFQVGNCNPSELEIPGAGLWMILTSLGIGLTISFLLYKKSQNR